MAAAEQSSGTYHPPISRLLTYYHRTLGEEELPTIQFHLKQCATCRARLQKIQATISLFATTPSIRRDCPTTLELYGHASFELKEERAREVQDHIMLCYTCREELLVFRDLRQAVRVGRSTFLSPDNWKLRSGYWRSRGLLAWLLQPRWRTWAIRAFQGGLGLVGIFLIYQFLQIDFSDDSSRRRSSSSSVKEEKEVEATEAPRAIVVGSTILYTFEFDKEKIRYLMPSDVASRWAEFQIRSETETAGIFKVVEPPGEAGLLVLRPNKPLSAAQIAEIEAEMQLILAGPARSKLQDWGQARAGLQQKTGGAVWLLNPPPKVQGDERLAGPENSRASSPGYKSDVAIPEKTPVTVGEPR